MSFEVPDDRRYLESHEWVTTGGDTVRIGVSDFAQDELGDVVFVELPRPATDHRRRGVRRRRVDQGRFGPVRTGVRRGSSPSTRSCSIPELVNEDPYGDGWLLEVEPVEGGDAEGLLDADEYDDQIA